MELWKAGAIFLPFLPAIQNHGANMLLSRTQVLDNFSLHTWLNTHGSTHMVENFHLHSSGTAQSYVQFPGAG